MMKNRISLLLIFATAIVWAGPVPAEWQGRYQSLLTTLKSKNVSAFKAMFAKGFVTVDTKGKKMSREAFFKEVDGLFAGVDKVDGHIDLRDVKVHGNTADVKFDFHLTLFRKGKKATMVHEAGVDTWQKMGGKWSMVKTVDSAFTVAERK